MTATAREIHYRARKVDALMAASRRAHVTAYDVATDIDLRDRLWAEARRALPTSQAPSDETWRWVVNLMQRDGVEVA